MVLRSYDDVHTSEVASRYFVRYKAVTQLVVQLIKGGYL
jgi:hypothetical protein